MVFQVLVFRSLLDAIRVWQCWYGTPDAHMKLFVSAISSAIWPLDGMVFKPQGYLILAMECVFLVWEAYRDHIPEEERNDFVEAYSKRLNSTDEMVQVIMVYCLRLIQILFVFMFVLRFK